MDILHPHLLSKQQLLDMFKQRHITIPRLEESTRDELIILYTKYLLPQPRRGSASIQQQDVEMTDTSGNANGSRKPGTHVRNRIVYSDSPVDNVSYGMKRIKLINSRGDPDSNSKPIVVKRTLEVSPIKSSTSTTSVAAASKRQKITWP